jgi:hypothetical protein
MHKGCTSASRLCIPCASLVHPLCIPCTPLVHGLRVAPEDVAGGWQEGRGPPTAGKHRRSVLHQVKLPYIVGTCLALLNNKNYRMQYPAFPDLKSCSYARQLRMDRMPALVVVALLLVVPQPLLAADSGTNTFHFTITSDLHNNTKGYTCVLDAMQAHSCGQGAFQISIGDVTDVVGQTPAAMRQVVDTEFSAKAVWYPIVGNHDIRGGKDSTSLKWRREEYQTGNGTRTPLKCLVGHSGPPGSQETTYSWDYQNVHFVALNEYWNGKTEPGSDVATDGDVVPALRAWLETDLATTKQPITFVFGHEPAFVEHRHVGNSLDGHPENRDAFWNVLKKHHVRAFFSGHIHFYYKELHEGVYQICDGTAGRPKSENRQTYLDVVVGSDHAQVYVWQNNAPDSTKWHLQDTITL